MGIEPITPQSFLQYIIDYTYFYLLALQQLKIPSPPAEASTPGQTRLVRHVSAASPSAKL